MQIKLWIILSFCFWKYERRIERRKNQKTTERKDLMYIHFRPEKMGHEFF